MPISFDDIARAAERIRDIAHRTPVMTSHIFDERSPRPGLLQVRKPAARRSV